MATTLPEIAPAVIQPAPRAAIAVPETRISSLNELMEFVSSRTSFTQPLWFRGNRNSSYDLVPSLYRHPTIKDPEKLKDLEADLMERFRHRAPPFVEQLPADDFQLLFLMQHYGVPTRLLDWTENPNVAAFFAVEDARQDKSSPPNDAAIWVMNPQLLNTTSLTNHSADKVLSIRDELLHSYEPKTAFRISGKLPVAVGGVHNSRRIVAQRGSFVLFGTNVNAMNLDHILVNVTDLLHKLIIPGINGLHFAILYLSRGSLTLWFTPISTDFPAKSSIEKVSRSYPMPFSVMPMLPRTLSWWRDEREDVDFDPVFQRKGRIWSESQKQYLIDSILNGFDVPKIYVADFTFLNNSLNTSKKKYAVIDGKQRLLTILEFFDGGFGLARDIEYIEDPLLSLGGLAYKDLLKNHPRIARKFDNTSLTVMSVITDDESKINDLFIRLNSSKPLTGAELRNALGGELPKLLRALAQESFFTKCVAFSKNRGEDTNTAAKLLLVEHRGALTDTKKAHLDSLVDEEVSEAAVDAAIDESMSDTETSTSDLARSAARVHKVLETMAQIFIEHDPLLTQQAQIVPYYWLIRELDSDKVLKVRAFLMDFQQQRDANKQIGGAGLPYLHEYALATRTSNDASSIRRRYTILREQFEVFLASR
jgi:FRG domain/Protein of unknown function DUF262